MSKKIVFVFHDSIPKSGATASMLDVIDGMLEAKVLDIYAIIPIPNHGLKEELERRNIKCYEAHYYNSRYSVHKSLSKFSLFKLKIKAWIKTGITFINAFWCYTQLKKKKFDLIYTNTSSIYMGAFLNLFYRVKHIWHFREFGIADQNQQQILSKYWFKKLVDLTTNKVIVISEALKSSVETKINPELITLVYDDVKYTPSAKRQVFKRSGALKLLIVGTLSEGKGQKFLIDCIKRLGDFGIRCHLGIVGDCTTHYAKELQKYVEKLNLNHSIQFLGFRDDLDKLRESYDIGVVASYSEAFGRVTIEGMLSRLLILATYAGSNKELIIEGKTGYFFSINDIESFVEKFHYISNNREKMDFILKEAYKESVKFNMAKASYRIQDIIVKQCSSNDEKK